MEKFEYPVRTDEEGFYNVTQQAGKLNREKPERTALSGSAGKSWEWKSSSRGCGRRLRMNIPTGCTALRFTTG